MNTTRPRSLRSRQRRARSSRSSTLAALGVLASLATQAGPAVAQTKTWTLDSDFVAADGSTTLTNVRNTPTPHQIILGRTFVSQTRLVWSTNYRYGYVVRLDSTTGKQTSRFDSVIEKINGIPTGARAANEWCNFGDDGNPATPAADDGLGNCPGRVTVDTNGDVWIVNRAFEKQGTLSKFSGDIAHCIDRNNNGKIETSNDANGNGVIDNTATDDPATPDKNEQEYFGQNDECILATIPIGGKNALPRGVAVDKRGKIWVATHNDPKLYRINPNEPVAIEQVVSVPGNPYSIATGNDWVYVSSSTGNVSRVHITNLTVETIPAANGCTGTYGVVADPTSDRAWYGGYFVNQLLNIANFATKTCTVIGSPAAPNQRAGTAVTIDYNPLAADPNASFNVWVAEYRRNSAAGWGASSVVHKYTPAGVLLATYNAAGSYPHGLSVDFDGFIWTVTHTPAGVSKMSATGTGVFNHPIGGPGVPDADPYLYSDYTGVQIDRQAPYRYVGFWEGKFDGGVLNIPWSEVRWNQEPQGAVPAETSLGVSARAANTEAELLTRAYTPVTNGAPLGGALKGQFIQVRAELRGPGFVTSVLSDISAKGPCSTPGEACCIKDTDCDDGNVCTEDSCPEVGGACAHKPVEGCCTVDTDCADQSVCTEDSCDAAMNTCVFTALPNCCISSDQCDDGNKCTADICESLGGACKFVQIEGCCTNDDDCKKGNVCSAAKCNAQNFCEGGTVPGCCFNDSDCADTDLCTNDVCDLANGTCTNTKIAGCCSDDTECDDKDVCTNDTCTGPGGTCVASPRAGCCTDQSPEVGQDCDLPKSPNDHPPCKPGKLACVNNKFVCQGAVKPAPELCDGRDNDCDGITDGAVECPSGTACMQGLCAEPCQGGEFGGCESNKQCVGGFCMPKNCAGVVCPEDQICTDGICHDPTVAGPATSATGSASGQPSGAGAGGGSSGAAQGGGPSAGGGGTSATAGTAGGGAKGESFGLSTGAGACNCTMPGTADGRDGKAHAALGCGAALLAVALTGRRRRRARSAQGNHA